MITEDLDHKADCIKNKQNEKFKNHDNVKKLLTCDVPKDTSNNPLMKNNETDEHGQIKSAASDSHVPEENRTDDASMSINKKDEEDGRMKKMGFLA